MFTRYAERRGFSTDTMDASDGSYTFEIKGDPDKADDKVGPILATVAGARCAPIRSGVTRTGALRSGDAFA